jgi:hypothetical protein
MTRSQAKELSFTVTPEQIKAMLEATGDAEYKPDTFRKVAQGILAKAPITLTKVSG